MVVVQINTQHFNFMLILFKTYGGTNKKYKMPIPISEDAQTKLKGVDFGEVYNEAVMMFHATAACIRSDIVSEEKEISCGEATSSCSGSHDPPLHSLL
ncbi:hypothetical protein P8452_40484 [Trifolium repens]|nr:hypothetical protein P8452_40484 [Trifolium repens]